MLGKAHPAMAQKRFDILCKNYDLLSLEKQAVARWLCEEWKFGEALAPKWLRHKYRQLFHFSLHEPDAPEKMARVLVIELLSTHRQEILSRRRSS
jgi:hypothetical protein